MTNNRTIIAVFESVDQAHTAIQELERAGVPRQEIKVNPGSRESVSVFTCGEGVPFIRSIFDRHGPVRVDERFTDVPSDAEAMGSSPGNIGMSPGATAETGALRNMLDGTTGVSVSGGGSLAESLNTSVPDPTTETNAQTVDTIKDSKQPRRPRRA